MYKKLIKPCLDYSLAVLIFVLLFIPLFVLLTIYWKGDPIFKQTRTGYSGKPFSIYKFKSMLEGEFSNEIDRVTNMGKFLRQSSLDEIPQILNVFNGKMSFIGPRPLLVEYLDLYNENQNRRHNVLPGITGWAQVNGRDRISWREKFELDIYYIENLSFWLDFKILIKTFINIITNSKDTGMIFEKFNGNN